MNILTKGLQTFIFSIFALLLSVSATSCSSDEPETYVEPTIAEQTVFMYLPWAGGGDIYTAVKDNIAAFEQAIKDNNGLDGRKLLVFASQNSSQSCLIKISYKNKTCVRDTLKSYEFSSLDYTTAEGLASILNDVKQIAPAKAYAMTIGAHGMGWLPSDNATSIKVQTKSNAQKQKRLTRYFGDPDEAAYQTDITTLAKAISNAGITMKYILFDDCYMSNIEVAYDLKDVTEHIIASTSEVMMAGFPYNDIGKALLTNDYEAICNGFYNFYINYTYNGDPYPYGTIGVTDCSEVDALAEIMKQINATYPEGLTNVKYRELQVLDRYTPAIFYDLGSYIDNLCDDEDLKATFNAQLEKVVPYKAHTEKYFTYLKNYEPTINEFSGITISDPSKNSKAATAKLNTAWYKATH